MRPGAVLASGEQCDCAASRQSTCNGRRCVLEWIAGAGSSSSSWHATGKRAICNASHRFSSHPSAFRTRTFPYALMAARRVPAASVRGRLGCCIQHPPCHGPVTVRATDLESPDGLRVACRGHLFCAMTGQLVKAASADAKKHMRGAKFAKAKGACPRHTTYCDASAHAVDRCRWRVAYKACTSCPASTAGGSRCAHTHAHGGEQLHGRSKWLTPRAPAVQSSSCKMSASWQGSLTQRCRNPSRCEGSGVTRGRRGWSRLSPYRQRCLRMRRAETAAATMAGKPRLTRPWCACRQRGRGRVIQHRTARLPSSAQRLEHL